MERKHKGDKPSVLVTGATGFVGLHVVKQLIETGKYKVFATYRKKKEEKQNKELFASIKEALGDDNYAELDFKVMDLLDNASVEDALVDMEYVIHVASPLPFASPKDPDDVLKPAVDGSKNIMNAAIKNKVKRVVLTSTAAVSNPDKEDHKFDETDGPVTENLDDLPTYMKSKNMAESAVTKIFKDQKGDDKTELIILCPSVGVGEFLRKSEGAFFKLYSEIMKGDVFSLLQIYFGYVDIHDIARAHINALTMGKNGQRYIITGETLKILDTAEIINKHFGKYGYNVTTGEMCSFTIWLGKIFDNDASYFYKMWNVEMKYSNELSKTDLKMKYSPVEDAIVRMCESFIKLGVVPDLIKDKKEVDAKSEHGKDKEEAKK